MASINDYFSFTSKSKQFAGVGNTFTSQAFLSVGYLATQWRFYFENYWGSDCAIAKNAWDTVGFFGLNIAAATLTMEGDTLAHFPGASAISPVDPGCHPEWGSVNNWSARYTQTVNRGAGDMIAQWFRDGASGTCEVTSVDGITPAGDIVMDSTVSRNSYECVNTPDQNGDGSFVVLQTIFYQEATAVLDSDGLFMFIFPECAVVPPVPSPAFSFLLSVDDFPSPRISFPPFNTRIPFQNYARVVPAVFIKRK